MKPRAFAPLLATFAILSALPIATAAFAQGAEQQMPTGARAAQAELRQLLTDNYAQRPLNYAHMSAEVAAAIRASADTGAMIRAKGAIQSVQYEGNPPGAHLFLVTFEKGAQMWLIAMNAEGKISTLYFHEAGATAGR